MTSIKFIVSTSTALVSSHTSQSDAKKSMTSYIKQKCFTGDVFISQVVGTAKAQFTTVNSSNAVSFVGKECHLSNGETATIVGVNKQMVVISTGNGSLQQTFTASVIQDFVEAESQPAQSQSAQHVVKTKNVVKVPFVKPTKTVHMTGANFAAASKTSIPTQKIHHKVPFGQAQVAPAAPVKKNETRGRGKEAYTLVQHSLDGKRIAEYKPSDVLPTGYSRSYIIIAFSAKAASTINGTLTTRAYSHLWTRHK